MEELNCVLNICVISYKSNVLLDVSLIQINRYDESF